MPICDDIKLLECASTKREALNGANTTSSKSLTYNGEEIYNGTIDLITGGFPCQDISISNQYGKGIKGERSGLWKEMFRIISTIRPKFSLIENSSALTFRGGDRLLSDLASIGHDAEWHCIPASAVGAFHKRERIYILSYPKSLGQKRVCTKKTFQQQRTQKQFMRVFKGYRRRSDLPTSRFLRSLNGVPNASHRIRAIGNAIVPQVAAVIMEAIKQCELDHKPRA